MSDQLTAPTPPPVETARGDGAPRLTRTVALQSVTTLVLGLVVGGGGGWLVERLWAPPTTGMVVDHKWYRGVVSIDPPLVAQNSDQSVFAGIGWYVVVAVVGGLLVGLVSALFLARRELVTLAAVVVATLAAGFVMYAVAAHLAPTDPQSLAAHARNGTVFEDTLRLGSHWIVLACPAGGLAAVAAVFLMLHPRGSRRRTTAS